MSDGAAATAVVTPLDRGHGAAPFALGDLASVRVPGVLVGRGPGRAGPEERDFRPAGRRGIAARIRRTRSRWRKGNAPRPDDRPETPKGRENLSKEKTPTTRAAGILQRSRHWVLGGYGGSPEALQPRSGKGSGVDLTSLIAGLPVPVLVHDLADGSETCVPNPSFTRVFGYTGSDARTLRGWAELAFPDRTSREALLSQWWAALAARRTTGNGATGATSLNEHRMFDRSGKPRDVSIGFTVHDDLAIITFQDLTATRDAEAALAAERHEHEQTAYALTENMPAGAYTMLLRPGSAMAEFAFVSTKFLQMLELTREEAVGDPMTAFSRVHPEDHAGWLQVNAKAFAERKIFSGETRIVANGETRWVRAESVPRELGDGSVIWEGILVDITVLKATEARLQAVLNAADASLWTLDLETMQTTWDARWNGRRGYRPVAWPIPWEGWMDSVHPEDRDAVDHAFGALRRGDTAYQHLTYRRNLSGDGWRWLRIHAGISERDPGGRPRTLTGVTFDITAEMTERARAQEQEALLREDLQRAQQRDTVAQVAGGVAHDLNNLIAVICGTAEMLQRRADGQPWLQEGLERIRRSVNMAHDLVAGLRGLVRPNLPRETHDLGRLLRDARDLLGRPRILQHQVRLALPDGQLPVWANMTEVAQVVVNLAINACDSGTPERPASVTLAARPFGTPPPSRPPDAGVAPDGGRAVTLFTISDTGLGITDSVRARMFRPNFTTKGRAGTGLGMLIVSTILQGNRAALWVDTTPGSGTTMTVAWPAEAPAGRGEVAGIRPAEAVAPDDSPVAADMLRGLRVLVVDDLPDVAEVLADMLEAAGAVAVAAYNPEEAAQALAEAPEVWSALVTDLHMPGMDGRSLARHAGSLSPMVPAILVTARPDTLGATPATEFAAVLRKPVTAAELARAVAGIDGLRRDRTPPHPP